VILHLDFEFFSPIDIKSAPLDVYANHKDARILMAAYAFDDGPVKVWEADSGPCPELRDGLKDPNNLIAAWNVNYERTVLAAKGMPLPIERFLDVMVLARYAGLPGRLKDCAKVPMIGVPSEEKTKSETLLINKFCKPQKDGTVKTKADYPEDWQLFREYCKKDVLTMRHVYNWLFHRFVFPERERKLWLLDQRINGRGLPVDTALALAGKQETTRLVAQAQKELRDLTGLENPNSVQQIHPWLQERGYKYDSLGKDFVKQAIAETDGDCKAALQVRLDAAKSSVKKFGAFVENTSPDFRLRNQFVFYGAHTGRWSGKGVQPQNLTRKETDQEALTALLSGNPVKSLEALTTCLRPCIRAPRGKKLVVADLSAIENRVLAWLSGCNEMLAIYEKGLDPYKVFAVELFYSDYWDERSDEQKYEAVTKSQRQLCKPAVLGCGYGLGGGQEREIQNGQKVKTGLWKYAESMGVSLSRELSHTMVQRFRSAYPEVTFYWNYLEDAFIAAYKTKKRQQVGAIYFDATAESVRILLPSGRSIHYLNPHAYKGADGIKISFDGLRQGGWGRQSTWGGRLTENVVQAVARDVLAEGMLRADKLGFHLVGHVHDEILCEERVIQPDWTARMTEHEPVAYLEKAMTDPIEWAPGLPLAAEGAEMEFYAK